MRNISNNEMYNGITVEKICVAAADAERTRVNRFPPQVVPRSLLQPTSQNPQERRFSFP
jgi:hypothetical protein